MSRDWSKRGLTLDEACELIREGRHAPYQYKKTNRELIIEAIDQSARSAFYWRERAREDEARFKQYGLGGGGGAHARGAAMEAMSTAASLAQAAGLATWAMDHEVKAYRKVFADKQAKLNAPAAAAVPEMEAA